MEEMFDSHLRIKVMAPRVFPIMCMGKPYVCNVFTHALREWAGPCAHKRGDHYPICLKLHCSRSSCVTLAGPTPSFAVLYTEKLAANWEYGVLV